MLELNANEARVLGTLIEKAQTVQSQYPITLNALVNGCNQKSNRLPEMTLSEDDVMSAMDGLRKKGLAREVMMSGSRVAKFRHVAREALEISTPELVILAELLLRGPQTLGEIRGRASRMHPLESLDAASAALDHLMQRQEPLVRKIAPAPGSRAERYMQLLAPRLHPVEDIRAASAMKSSATGAINSVGADSPTNAGERIEQLERDVESLKLAVRRLAESLGEADPL